MKKILIALEGLPGSGKTTLGQKLASCFNGLYIPEIIPTNKYRPSQDEYYIESEFKKIELLKKSTKKYIFLDRNHTSMLAYNYGKMKLGMKNILEELELKFMKMPEPDLYVYLKIDKIALCNQRKGFLGRNPIWINNSILKHVREYYEKYFFIKTNVFTVFVDKIDIEKSFELIESEIKMKYD